MTFSILIAHHNNYTYFLDCYKSILEQTYQNYEVIIVDDYSTDDSFDKLTVLLENDDRFKLYRNSENKGVGYTKRKCIELATGEICGFVDPDDAILPNAIEISLSAYKNKNIIATYSKFYICNHLLQIQKIFPNTRRINNKKTHFLNINFEVAHLFTFKKNIYLQTEGIIAHYKTAEDQDLYLKLYEKGNFYFINEPLLLYRVHKKGLSHTSDEIKVKEKNKSWHSVLYATLRRRNITKIYGKEVEKIDNLPQFILEKQNSLLRKLWRKLGLNIYLCACI